MFKFKTLRNLSLYALTLGAFAFILPVSHADILIEPYLGYYMGKSKQTGTKDLNNKGVIYGGRLGYQSMGFMLGADYMTGKWTDDNSPSDDLTPTALGAFVGYNFPVLIRVYGVYNFSTKMESKVNSTTTKLEGNSYKLGVGYTGIPFVSINLEYLSASFNKLNGNTLDDKLTAGMYGLTVSVPFDL